jgi:ABC-type dipeptide/oligopeptide/nickel transport system permease subunit
MEAPWTAGVAIACVAVTGARRQLAGDALRDRFDPRDRTRS